MTSQRLPCFVLSILLWAGSTTAVHADPASRLVRTLTESRDVKERISAAVALARLKDSRAQDALIGALADDHDSLRAVAAEALGRVGDERALPALRRAAKDQQRRVRKQARRAIKSIKRNAKQAARHRARSRYKISRGPGDPGFGRSPRAVVPRVHVAIKSTADKSKGKLDRDERATHAQRMRAILSRDLDSAQEITISARLAAKLRLPLYNLDVSITRFDRQSDRKTVSVMCQVRLAISDARGRMRSFLNGQATVKVPRGEFDERHMPELRLEALESAVHSVRGDLVGQLLRLEPSAGVVLR